VPNPNSIVFLITGLNYGGAETQLSRLVPRLRDRGWQVRVLSMISSAGLGDEIGRAGIPVLSLGIKQGSPSLRALLKARALLRQWQPMVLTNFMFHANVLGRVAGRMARVPVIISSVRSENDGGATRDRLLRLTDHLGSITTVNSQRVAESLIRRGVVPEGRLQVIHNGLTMEDYVYAPEDARTVREELGIHPGQFMWSAVGNLREPKDYPSLLHAFQVVHEQRPDARLRVAGQGPLQDQLEALAGKLHLQDVVQFIGFRHDIPRFLAASDAFTLSSAWEGLPNALMEACATGRPVVSTRVGGVPELVDDGVSGLIVPPRDPGELARGMLRIMACSDEQRRQMGAAARDKMRAQFDMEHITDLWEQLFQQLIARHTRQGDRPA